MRGHDQNAYVTDSLAEAEKWLREQGYHYHDVVKNPTPSQVRYVQEWAHSSADFVYVFVHDDGSVFIADNTNHQLRGVPAPKRCGVCAKNLKGRFVTTRVILENCPACGEPWSMSPGGPYCKKRKNRDHD